MDKDIQFIKKTFQLARRATGLTSPNPMVGAVIVRNNKVISQGYHKRAGLPHAEVEAIRRADRSLKGSTLYINLEPCCHFGKTPPCVDEIIRQGIKRVVIATLDPNPAVKGKTVERLKKRGIKVKVGVCEAEARDLNEIFFTNMEKKRPFIVAKIAQTLDGKIATKKGLSKWITSEKSRSFSKSLRDKYDCILAGVNTIIHDDPGLNGFKKIPFKAVIDPDLRIPLNSYLIQSRPEKLILVTSHKSAAKAKKLPKGINVLFLREKNGVLSARQIVSKLYKFGITSVFIEGGSESLGRFFLDKIIDKFYFFIAPKIMGGKDAVTSIGAEGFPFPSNCPQLRSIGMVQIDQDIMIWGYPQYQTQRAHKRIYKMRLYVDRHIYR